MGGTDVMVELNFDRHRPPALLDLTRVPRAGELGPRRRRDPARRRGHLHPGDRRARRRAARAGAWPRAPSARRRSATAARSAATSVPPRRPGTRTPRCSRPSPRSSCPPSTACAGCRPHEFYTGVKKHAGRPDELITAVWIRPAGRPAAVQQDRHPQRDGDRGRGVRAGPAPRRAAGRDGHRLGRADPAPGARRRGRSWPATARLGVARRRARRRGRRSSGAWSRPAASPIDDVRGTAAYRLHALAVMARRCLGWAWTAHQKGDD